MGKIHEEIVANFKERLSDHPESENYKIEVFEVLSANPSYIEGKVWHILDKEFDIILPIGERCSVAAQKVIAEKRRKIPIIFGAVGYPVDAGLVEDKNKKPSHITGVYTQPTSNTLPLHLLLMLRPDLKNYLIVFRTDAKSKRVELEAWRMRKYLQAYRKNATLVPVDGEESLEKTIEPNLEKGMAVTTPVGGLLSLDLKTIETSCKKNKAFFFGNSDGVIPKNAIIGYKVDASRTGIILASLVEKVLINGISPDKIPAHEIKQERPISLLPDVFKIPGSCVPSENSFDSLDNVVDKAHLPKYRYGVIEQSDSERALRLNWFLKSEGLKLRDEAFYFSHLYQGGEFDQAYLQEQYE